MKILVLNCGSSSIKYALYDMDTKKVPRVGPSAWVWTALS